MEVDERAWSRTEVGGSWRVTGASVVAIFHVLLGAFGTFICVALLLGDSSVGEVLAALGASLFFAAVGIACLCRFDTARLFIAGEFAVLTLASILLFLALLIERIGCAAVFALIPAALAALGASMFVSTDVRTWCRRP